MDEWFGNCILLAPIESLLKSMFSSQNILICLLKLSHLFPSISMYPKIMTVASKSPALMLFVKIIIYSNLPTSVSNNSNKKENVFNATYYTHKRALYRVR